MTARENTAFPARGVRRLPRRPLGSAQPAHASRHRADGDPRAARAAAVAPQQAPARL